LRIPPRATVQPKQNKRHRRHASPFPNQIVKFTLVIGDAGRHLRLQQFHRKNLYPHINDIAHVESHMFDKEIVGYEGVFPELHFDGNALFHEISLIV